MSTVELPVPTHVLLEEGGLTRVGELTAPWGVRPLVVCGRGAMRRTGTLDRAVTALRLAGLHVTVFDGVRANPRSDDAQRAVTLARRERCDVVVGLGGGSAIDTAKAVAASVAGADVADLIGTTLAEDAPVLPIVAVPTTAGSGSEVTKGAILTDSARRLRSGIRGPALFPVAAVVDPELTASLPTPVAVESGFDALTHAVEGCVARGATSRSRDLATQAIRAIAGALPTVAAGRATATDRYRLAHAALLGGVNVATVSTCLPHRLQQAMGAVPGVCLSHGAGLAALYPAWLAALEEAGAAGLDVVAGALGSDTAHDGLIALRRRIGLTATLRDAGYRDADLSPTLTALTGNLDNDPIAHADPEAACRVLLDAMAMDATTARDN